MAASSVFDVESYSSLLSEAHPRVPRTKAENEQLIAIVAELQQKERLSPEEVALMELVLLLIEDFEEKHYSTKKAAPHDALREMMRSRGLKPKDVYEIFGSKGTTSEVLRGKRAISKAAAKALGEKFGMRVELLL
jgi:HTH-type transcriptional regulator/antitoxin HigA